MIPPSGHMAGVWCRIDATPRRAQGARPTRSIMGANGLGFQVTTAEQGGLNKVGINCIRAFSGRGIRIWGARTLSSDPEWRYINVRRLFNFVSESIMEGTQWSVFEPNDSGCGCSSDLGVELPPRASGATARCSAPTRAEAFYVKCDAETNPPEVDRGRPGRLRDRHLAGQAGRVRDLPAEPVHRRRRRRSQPSDLRRPRKELLNGRAQGDTRPWHLTRSTLEDVEQDDLNSTRSTCRRAIDHDRRRQARRRAGQAAARQDAGHQMNWSPTTIARAAWTRTWRSRSGSSDCIEKGAIDGNTKDITIDSCDYEGHDRCSRGSSRSAWPSSYSVHAANAQTHESTRDRDVHLRATSGSRRRATGDDATPCRRSSRSRSRGATSTPRGSCTATGGCAWRRRGTRSSRCGRWRYARTRRTSPSCCWRGRSRGSATVTEITPELVEGLFAADFDHLQRLYERINSDGEAVGVVSCPACAHEFEVDLTEIEDGRLGE